MRWLRICALATLAALALRPLAATAASESDTPASYSVGVAPQFEARKLYATWKPLLDALEKATGQRFRFASAGSVPEFELAVARGSYDFVYVNPYHLYKERQRQGYVPLVRDLSPLYGIVVVRADSPLRTPAELAGKSLAVPSPNAVGASMLIQAELDRSMAIQMKIVNAKSHSSAYLHAINQLTDAAGGVEKTFAEQPLAIRDALRVVYRTRDFPSHPIAAHPRVAESVRERVRQALLDISADPARQQLLQDIPISRAVAASFRDYEAFRNLDLDAYWFEPASPPR